LAIAAMLALPLIGTHSAAALDLPEAKKWELYPKVTIPLEIIY